MTRQPLLASRHSRSVVLFSQETTGVPTDVFLPHWAGGLDAALDVTVTHPLQDATRARAATTPGHAMTVAYENKCRIAEELCREQEIAFIPVVAESLGGWHQVALDQFWKLGSALARHTSQDEGEKQEPAPGRLSIKRWRRGTLQAASVSQNHQISTVLKKAGRRV